MIEENKKYGSLLITHGKYKISAASDKVIMANLVKLSGGTSEDYHMEIGTATGKSLTVVHDLVPNVPIVTIDPYPQKKATNFYKGDPRVRFIKEKSNKGIKIVGRDGISPTTVYIDGDHTKKWAKSDIERSWKIWNHKGFLGGHDYTRQRAKHWGVIEAVRDFFGVYRDCKINRRYPCREGVLHICDTFWFYIDNDQMHKFEDYLRDL